MLSIFRRLREIVNEVKPAWQATFEGRKATVEMCSAKTDTITEFHVTLTTLDDGVQHTVYAEYDVFGKPTDKVKKDQIVVDGVDMEHDDVDFMIRGIFRPRVILQFEYNDDAGEPRVITLTAKISLSELIGL